MTVLAQQDNPSIWDNKVLDEWTIPFGQWIDQAVDWIDQNMEPVLDVIRAPFAFLLENLVDRFLADISWVIVCVAFFIIGSLIRNVRVGTFSALALAGCGLLGTAYWLETARTIGMILVAVILCAAVGIPLGVLSGRFDGVWNVVRPTLDAMQVVHAFVYMLPVIFFFSIGVVPGTMVTMIFALPPLIRLTNLGIRQVPEDVVEAARSYGAPELRVLFDVQLPLARPAIMTGLNQTLLLSISMIGIAAIMGAGGLGLLVFRAVSNLDTGLAASAGLALFLVAVVLDRISQPEASDGGSLFSRIATAWHHRQDVAPLLDQAVAAQEAREVEEAKAPRVTPATGSERNGIYGAVAGGALAIISTLLAWGNDSGLISAYSRRVDETLEGQSFNGISASGGTFFGYLVLVAGAFIVVAGLVTLQKPGRGPRWFSADGAMMASGLMLVAALGYFVTNTSPLVADYSHGVGVYVAILAGIVSFGACYHWVGSAPYNPKRPLKASVGRGRLFGGAVAVGIVVIAMFSGWTFDRRADVVITPEVQQQMDELLEAARQDPSQANVIAGQIAALQASARQDLVVVDGLSDEGPRLGIPALLVSILALAALLPAAGVFGIDDHRQWMWSAISAAMGLGLLAIGTGWIGGLARTSDPQVVSGIGAFLVFIAGYFVFAANRGVLSQFERAKIFDDSLHMQADVILSEKVGHGDVLDLSDADQRVPTA